MFLATFLPESIAFLAQRLERNQGECPTWLQLVVKIGNTQAGYTRNVAH
jgi:hypothetical protein